MQLHRHTENKLRNKIILNSDSDDIQPRGVMSDNLRYSNISQAWLKTKSLATARTEAQQQISEGVTRNVYEATPTVRKSIFNWVNIHNKSAPCSFIRATMGKFE